MDRHAPAASLFLLALLAGAQTVNADLVLEAANPVALQTIPDDRYDWGVSVMRDGDLYRMWWVRWGGAGVERFPYTAALPDGATYEFTYPDRGDRIYYAESRDGLHWPAEGPDYDGPPEAFGPDAPGPLMVMGAAESAGERMHVGTPTVVKVGGVFYMYYESASEFAVERAADGTVQVKGEYHNSVSLATSTDGKTWNKYPCNDDPLPLVRAPEANKRPDRQRYGLGQPSVFYKGGRFVMHYVDSCNGPGDFIVRLEADNPRFENAAVFQRTLEAGEGTPAGSVARFAQTDVKYLGEVFYLVRPAYETGNLGLMASRTGVFAADARATLPKHVFPQVRVTDPRGDDWRERLFPDFLTDPHGQILVEDGHVVLFYGSGHGWKEEAGTWDLQRSEVSVADLEAIAEACYSTKR